MQQRLTERLSCAGIPEASGFVQCASSRKDHVSVRTEIRRLDGAIVLQGPADWLARFHLPQASGSIPAGGKNRLTVRGKADRGYSRPVLQLMQHWRAAPDFPQFGNAFLMTTEDSLSVRTEHGREDLANSRKRTADGLARVRVP